MPFVSEKQRRWMFKNEPAMAHKWAHDEHTSVKNHRMPSRNGADVHTSRRAKRAARRMSR